MKRERNLQEAEEEEAHNLHRDRRKTVKTEEMDNGTEEESQRSAADKSVIQEPADLSHNNTRIHHHHHHHQNEDYPAASIPAGSSSENPPISSEDPNLQKQDKDENPEMDDEAAGQRERDGVQESIIQERGNKSTDDSNLHCVSDLHKEEDEDRRKNPVMDIGAGDEESVIIQEHGNNNNNNEGKDRNEKKSGPHSNLILHHDHQNEREEEEVDHISYVRLPQDFPVSIPSGRSELDSSVLNDHWVLSVKNPLRLKDSNLHKSNKEYFQEPGNNEGHHEASSSNNNNNNKKLNQYQIEMLDVEDEQFEFDMLFESVNSTIECIEQVYRKIFLEKKIKVKEGEEFQIEQHFRFSHLRCIKRLFGGTGGAAAAAAALGALRNDPIVAVPIILKRLEKKNDELEMLRPHLEFLWSLVYDENHAKSLIHPSYIDA